MIAGKPDLTQTAIEGSLARYPVDSIDPQSGGKQGAVYPHSAIGVLGPRLAIRTRVNARIEPRFTSSDFSYEQGLADAVEHVPYLHRIHVQQHAVTKANRVLEQLLRSPRCPCMGNPARIGLPPIKYREPLEPTLTSSSCALLGQT